MIAAWLLSLWDFIKNVTNEQTSIIVFSDRLTLSTAEYENIFRKINGWAQLFKTKLSGKTTPLMSKNKYLLCLFSLLFIGGAADLVTSDYARVAKIFYRLALEVCIQHSVYYVALLSLNQPLSHWLSLSCPTLNPSYQINQSVEVIRCIYSLNFDLQAQKVH